jgi:hypothetical protein
LLTLHLSSNARSFLLKRQSSTRGGKLKHLPRFRALAHGRGKRHDLIPTIFDQYPADKSELEATRRRTGDAGLR